MQTRATLIGLHLFVKKLTKTRNHLSLYLSASSLINDDWRILFPEYHQNHPPPRSITPPMPLPRYKLF